MLDFKLGLIVAVAASLWLGYGMDAGFRQTATYNLIGKASKRGLSSKRAEKAVQKHFTKWNWTLTAGGLFSATLAVLVWGHGRHGVVAFFLFAVALCAFGASLANLTRSYMHADRELS